MSSPQVSIGLPVFNGEPYLAEAIESILGQTFSDFELVISDNASTDRTREICQAYADRDPRIQYSRTRENIGAARNFNRVLESAQGEYFKWAPHDDLVAADFVEKCLACLEANPKIVLCYPLTRTIDANGNDLEDYNLKLKTDVAEPHLRFGELLLGHACYETFGLIRTDALKKTPGIGNYGHGDGVLLAQLALMGRFQQIPETLFFARRHSGQSMHRFGVYDNPLPDYHAYTEWFDPKKSRNKVWPYWRLLYEYNRCILLAGIPYIKKLKCYAPMLKWVYRMRGNLKNDLLIGLKRLVSPAQN